MSINSIKFIHIWTFSLEVYIENLPGFYNIGDRHYNITHNAFFTLTIFVLPLMGGARCG